MNGLRFKSNYPNAVKFQTDADAKRYIMSFGKRADWKRTTEHIGKGTPNWQMWEVYSLDDIPRLEVRRGTYDAGTYRID